ncbi:unnamed protein product, partial [Mesorhabditis belari]|uniref:DUF7596 domain-containing protein n=1 Tax=Mesorhabditis belari TaxID=2138241 RepID=A0AAF3FBD2_9BILA
MSEGCVSLAKSAFLPATSLPEATSAVIEDNGKSLVKQTLIKYSPNQAYCVLSSFDSSLEDKEIRVEEDKENPLNLRLTEISKTKIEKHLLPVFVRFHHPLKQRSAESHISDRCFEAVLGRTNLELKKNVTMDSFDRVSTWRDEAGFVVSDRHRYELATFNTKDLLSELMSADTPVVRYDSSNLEAVSDFDHSVCGTTRTSLIEALAKNAEIYLIKTTSEVNGMLVGKGDRVVALYAETIELAHALIQHYINLHKLAKLSFFTRLGIWQSTPESSRPVYRFHTRTIPSQLKWNKVYAANLGVHLL